jgi:hypothetical protein
VWFMTDNVFKKIMTIECAGDQAVHRQEMVGQGSGEGWGLGCGGEEWVVRGRDGTGGGVLRCDSEGVAVTELVVVTLSH